MPGGNSACAVPNRPPWYDGDDPNCPFGEEEEATQEDVEGYLMSIFYDGGPQSSLLPHQSTRNEDIVRNFIQLVWNMTPITSAPLGQQIEEVVARDYTRWRDCKIGTGLDLLLLAVMDTRRAVPDLLVEIIPDSMGSNGDKVFARLKVSNGTTSELPSTVVYQITYGKVAYTWTWYPFPNFGNFSP